MYETEGSKWVERGNEDGCSKTGGWNSDREESRN